MQMHLHADDPIVRVSGNDFVCALHDSDHEDACRRFEAIQKTIGHYHHGGSASVGFAALLPGDTLRQLAERADVALREVKRGGEPTALAAGAS
jgi:PleD family two-component response regulator